MQFFSRPVRRSVECDCLYKNAVRDVRKVSTSQHLQISHNTIGQGQQSCADEASRTRKRFIATLLCHNHTHTKNRLRNVRKCNDFKLMWW